MDYPPHLDPPPQGGRKIFRAFYFLSNLNKILMVSGHEKRTRTRG